MPGVRIQLRRDTASQWASVNPILRAGEMGLETDTDKIKVGDGSSHWNDLTYKFGAITNNNTITVTGGNMAAASGFANADAIITHFGLSDIPVFMDSNIAIPSLKTFPSNSAFVPGGGKFVKSSSGAIHFAGPGLVDTESQLPVFSGFAAGDVTWTSANAYERPSVISTELWDTGNTSLTDRLDRADKAVASGVQIKIACYPRVITGTVTFRQNREIFFTDGDYTNTSSTQPFLLDSYMHMHGSWLAKLHEGITAPSNQLVGVVSLHDALESIIVENLWFEGNLFTTTSNAGATVILGNAHNSAIRNNVFYRVHEYATTLGGYSDTGNYALNSEISDNLFISCGLQVTPLINGKNIRIVRNRYYQAQSTESPSYAVIDIEPNLAGDIIDGLIIEDNYIDARDPTPAPQNFATTAVNTGADTVTLPNHGIGSNRIGQFTTTGTLPAGLSLATDYMVIPLDNNTIQVKIPGTSTPINITSQGTGTHTFTTTPKFVNGIIVQAGGANAGCVNVSVHKNTIFGSYLSNGIQVTGGQYFNVANNYVNFAGQSAVNANQIANGDFSNNHAYKSGTGGVKTYTFLGCSDCFIDGQRMDGDNPGDYAHQETESTGTVNTSSTGNTVTRTAGILFYPWMVGKTITVNSVDRVIATVTDITHCTLTTDPGNHTGVALTSKFANNQYSNNNGDYALVGTSQIVSAFEDGKLTTVADTAYTALFSDGIIVYTTLTAGRTVTLLSAVGRKGKELIIKDGAGSASTHNITVDGAGSETIDGSLTYVISANYGKVRIKSDGANWITL